MHDYPVFLKNTGLIMALLFWSAMARAQGLDYRGLDAWSWEDEGNTEYMLYTPSGYQEGTPCPLAIYLHGCCGEDDHATLRNAVDPPVRMWHSFGENKQDEPTFIMAPKTTRGWSQKFPDIKRVINRMIADGLVDPRRIYMTGFSMGGAGTWQFMEQYPGVIAAAIPMGTGAQADFLTVVNTPIWAIRGEDDWYARNLPRQVDSMRRETGFTGGAMEWVTGVNPRYTSFEGIGHGVQWEAASTLPLTSWAYEKINDGNINPVVYFTSPGHGTFYNSPGSQEFEVTAFDRDGRITEVEIRVDQVAACTLIASPYTANLYMEPGDHLVEAVARDNQGKTSTAVLFVQVDIEPAFLCDALPQGTVGSYYEFSIPVKGNSPVLLHVAKGSEWPEGLLMDQDGRLSGIPVQEGTFPVSVVIRDSDGDSTGTSFIMVIGEKKENVVVVSDVRYPHDSLRAEVSVFRSGSLPNLGAGTEVNISEPSRYDGMTYICTDLKAAGMRQDDLLSFSVDKDVMVYVAYETFGHLYESDIPRWLEGYEKQDPPLIEAQYRYFEVYGKSFQKGRISLPGAAAADHYVKYNYFVLVAPLHKKISYLIGKIQDP